MALQVSDSDYYPKQRKLYLPLPLPTSTPITTIDNIPSLYQPFLIMLAIHVIYLDFCFVIAMPTIASLSESFLIIPCLLQRLYVHLLP